MVAEICKLYVSAFDAPGDEVFNDLAAKLFAEDDDQRFLGEDGLAEVGLVGVETRIEAGIENCRELAIVAGLEVELGFGLARELDGWEFAT